MRGPAGRRGKGRGRDRGSRRVVDVGLLEVLGGLLSSGVLLHRGHYRVSACGCRILIDGTASIEMPNDAPSIGYDEMK